MAHYQIIFFIQIAIISSGKCLHKTKNPVIYPRATGKVIDPTLINTDSFQIEWNESDFEGSGEFNVNVDPICNVAYKCSKGIRCSFTSSKYGPCIYAPLVSPDPCTDIVVTVTRGGDEGEVSFNLAPAIFKEPIAPELKITGAEVTLNWTTPASSEYGDITCATSARASLQVGTDGDWKNSVPLGVVLGKSKTNMWTLENCEHGDLKAKVVYLTKKGDFPTNKEFLGTNSPNFPGVGITGLSADGSSQRCSLVVTWTKACKDVSSYTVTCEDEVNGNIGNEIYTCSGLGSGSRTVIVQGYLNDGNKLGNNQTVTENVIQAAPGAPIVELAKSSEDAVHELSVTWTAPETPVCAGVPTGYSITYCETEECTKNATTTAGANETPILLTKLQACTDYTVFVAATWSDESWDAGSASKKTDGGAPGPPSIKWDTISTIHEIELSWIESTTDTSCPLSKYIVKWEPDDGDGSGTHNEVGLNTSDKITDLTCNMNYKVTVTAFAEGDENTSDSKDISTKDKAPGNTTVDSVSPVEASNTQLTVKWSIPSYDCYPGSNLSDYKVSWRAEGEGQSTHSQNEASTSYTINDLVYCTTYNISVKARSSTGLLGDPAGTKNATTNADHPEKPIITEKSISKDNITLSWTESDPIKANSCPISKYTVDWMPKDGEGSGAYELYTITGLTCNKNYNVTVTATATDDKDTSSQGNIIKTNDTAPETEPGNIGCNEVDAPTKLSVNWEEVKSLCDGDLKGYMVSWEVDGEPLSHETDNTATNYTVPDLKPCTEYSVNVAAISQKGLVGPSGTATGTTGIDVPGKPDPSIEPESSTASTLLVSWTQGKINDCAITNYKVEWSSENGGSDSGLIDGTKDNYDITGLICNTNYIIIVTAYTSDTKFIKSTAIQGITKDQAPGAPTITEVSPLDDDDSTKLTVEWSPPTYTCTGSSLGNYSVNWTASVDDDPSNNVDVTETPYTIEGLVPCTTYTVTVAARSETGLFGVPGTGTANTTVAVPGIISNISRESFTPYSMNLSWNPPSTTSPGNPCAITNYTVQWSNISGEADGMTETVTDTYLNIISLDACTDYYINVTAYTVKGAGKSSNITKMATGVDAPKVDEDKVNITSKSRAAQVTWEKPGTSCNLTYDVKHSGYTLWTNNQTSDPGKIQTIDDPIHSATLDELLPYSEYDVCVTVNNNINGENTCKTFTTEEAVPSAPRNVSVDDFDDVSLTLSWDYPEAENGILLNYVVSWGMDGESLINHTVDADDITSHTIYELEEGNYFFSVRAVNSKGSSVQSDSIEQEMNGPTVCGGGCIAGIVIGLLLVALAIPAFIFRDRIMQTIKPGPPPVEESPYELRGAAILKSDFRRHVEELGLDRAERAYQMLNDESQQKTKFAAAKPFNKGKNRFANIHPFDETRVKLQLMRNGPKGSDYINANHITFPDTFALKFTATQGPLDSTINDFWRMIWEHKVYDTVMLCNLFEKGKSKCAQYWTENGERSMEFGDFKISCQAEEEDESKTFITRYIDVVKDGQHRMVKQHHFLAWPDFGVPENEEGLLRFLASVKRNVNEHGTNVLTHCSAGVGRTGTFIALWVLTSLLEQNKSAKSIDVHQISLMMREGRSDMIQTKDQYLYLHKCLLKYMEDTGNSFPISNKDDEEPIYGNVNTGYQQ